MVIVSMEEIVSEKGGIYGSAGKYGEAGTSDRYL